MTTLTFDAVSPTAKQDKKFTTWARLKIRLKMFIEGFQKKIERAKLESLTIAQQKGIQIASLCIENKLSKLYVLPSSSLYRDTRSNGIQIELPEIVITIEQTNGFYEVDFVYIGQAVPTSDKVIYDTSGVTHIFDKFDKEVADRMKDNLKRRDKVVEDHLENILTATQNLRKVA